MLTKIIGDFRFDLRVATEDKYSSSPLQVDINDMTSVVNEKADQEEGKST